MKSIRAIRCPGKMTVRVAMAIGFAIVACGLLLQANSYLTHAIFPWTRYAYSSDSMEPVDLLLGKTVRQPLRIPRSYIASWPSDDQGVSAYVQIEAYLPDMLPKYPDS